MAVGVVGVWGLILWVLVLRFAPIMALLWVLNFAPSSLSLSRTLPVLEFIEL